MNRKDEYRKYLQSAEWKMLRQAASDRRTRRSDKRIRDIALSYSAYCNSNDANPLTGCELCAHWSPGGCMRRCSGFPDVGYFCRSYEREPGVEG